MDIRIWIEVEDLEKLVAILKSVSWFATYSVEKMWDGIRVDIYSLTDEEAERFIRRISKEQNGAFNRFLGITYSIRGKTYPNTAAAYKAVQLPDMRC